MNEDQFYKQLSKAINIHHHIGKRDGDLLCKFYKREYNIVRNDPIGVGHILALSIYTYVSGFCTKFRETQVNNKWTSK